MPHPMTHLCVAERVLSLQPMPDYASALFLLGSIAPDALHYRSIFDKEEKKISHLCPVSDEKWGRVTENAKWFANVLDFLHTNDANDPFILGYCTHIITDIHNNKVLWTNYRLAHPEDAAKGYDAEYHKEWAQIDARLYQELNKGNRIETLLPLAKARDIANLVTAEEINAIRHNVLYVSYPNKPPAETDHCRYILYEAVRDLIEESACWAVDAFFPSDN